MSTASTNALFILKERPIARRRRRKRADGGGRLEGWPHAAKIIYPRSKNRPYTHPQPCSAPVRAHDADGGAGGPGRGAGDGPKVPGLCATIRARRVERREAQRPGGGPRKPVVAGRARLGTGFA